MKLEDGYNGRMVLTFSQKTIYESGDTGYFDTEKAIQYAHKLLSDGYEIYLIDTSDPDEVTWTFRKK